MPRYNIITEGLVLERIKEIGLRLSIGAKKEDIVLQFLFEAVMISVSGGIIGVILGITMATVVSSSCPWATPRSPDIAAIAKAIEVQVPP